MKTISPLALACIVFFCSLGLAAEKAEKAEKADKADPPIKLQRGKHFNKPPAEAVQAIQPRGASPRFLSRFLQTGG